MFARNFIWVIGLAFFIFDFLVLKNLKPNTLPFFFESWLYTLPFYRVILVIYMKKFDTPFLKDVFLFHTLRKHINFDNIFIILNR